MEENNKFLNSYKIKTEGKKASNQEENSVVQKQKSDLKYENESGFIKPAKRNTKNILAAPQKKRNILAVSIGAVVLLCIVIGIFFLLDREVEVIDFTGWTEGDV